MNVPVDLTGLHLGVARSAARRSHEDPSQSIVAIVFGAAAFEGWLASFVTHAERHVKNDRGPIHSAAEAIADVLPGLERSNAQWFLKLQVAAILLSGRPLDRGVQPWQDIDLLFRIRNSVIHPSLTWLPVATDAPGSQPHAFVQGLVSRGVIPAPLPLAGIPGSADEDKLLHPTPISALLQPEVAVWAVDSAVGGLRGVASLCPASVFKTQIEWWLTRIVGVDTPPSN
jgi:hypothetical protein